MKQKEINDLIISWLTISLCFSWVFSSFNLISISLTSLIPIGDFLSLIPIMLIVTGTAFILHELAHRQVAKKFGAHAEFRMWPYGLAIAAGFSLLTGWVFAAPGAVYIYGHFSAKQNGLISLAGPATNIIIAIIFLIIGMSLNNSFIQTISQYGLMINLFLGFFNLIPIGPLDGAKVFRWNPLVWAVFFIPVMAYVFF
ncbi:MAG: site-2 protease family protein [Candidatus Diapherotrites archaeon]|nr:site-2 protease family protein [Candidatus Diapherotrites archaeon]